MCADPKELRRVLSNIVENAIKYTPDGGRIILSAREEDSHVAISVTDNGRGIPAEDMPILFDKFHRGRPAAHSAAMAEARLTLSSWRMPMCQALALVYTWRVTLWREWEGGSA